MAARSCNRTTSRGATAATAISQRCALSRDDENRCLDVLAHPELEHQQAPEPVAVVAAARLVLLEEPHHGLGPEPAAIGREDIACELAQVLPEPAPERNAEPGLAAPGHPGREL